MADNTKLVWKTDEVLKAIDDGAIKRMSEAVNEVRTVTLETLSGQRSGRTYFVPGTQKTYTASAPGEPPAQVTSGLRQSVRGVIESTGPTLDGVVGTPLSYGARLEKGDSTMAPRPWLKPSFEKAQDKVKAIFARKWF